MNINSITKNGDTYYKKLCKSRYRSRLSYKLKRSNIFMSSCTILSDFLNKFLIVIS